MLLKTTSRFDRRLKNFVKSHPELRGKTLELIDRIVSSPFHPLNKTHMLSGTLKGVWASDINYHYRILFLLSDDAVKLVNVGSHDEVY
ncbi:MAG: type II toxin-antitoxin system mRNA interferase toxin, RelE/StbE family [bacterium]|nr:type II toxin-antitoxin system mRNA interferase toxin, RelE/StbE family [bacterium]